MQDFKNTRDFRKMKMLDPIYDDPTYLSFFFMFDFYTEHSPLLNGEAKAYLEDVLQDTTRAEALDNFIKILKKVNSEYPWFWQSVSGLETAKQYDMLDPFWGEDKAIEIGCLETVELTVSGMMDLYKRAAYDFNRWVEVIPRNLRRFKMYIWVSEVRTFQTSTLKKSSTILAAQQTNPQLDLSSGDSSIKSVRPFFKVELGHCEFDPDSTSSIFADLNRTPEGEVTSTIKIKWQTVNADGKYANSTISEGDSSIGEMLGNIAKEKAGEIVDSAIDRTVENIQARLLLGNVHGINTASTLQDAVNAGSINGIANVIEGSRTTRSTIPSGELGSVYDPSAPDEETLSEINAHDDVAGDSEKLPEGGNVYDRTPRDSEGPINENVHE
jgi:hypothetical protein